MLPNLLKQFTAGVAHLLYPNLCEGCTTSLMHEERVLCLACLSELSLTGYHNQADNETAMRVAGRIPFVRATSLAYFVKDGLLQHLLHRLKYKDRKDIGVFLGALLGDELRSAGWHDVDIVVPVPLHRRKEADRGYNQSLLIAEGLSKALAAKTSGKNLIRSRQTDSQTRKTRTERLENMKDAFGVMEPAAFAHKHVLLCDDVLTTGATLEACALALSGIPHIKISVATIGIAAS